MAVRTAAIGGLEEAELLGDRLLALATGHGDIMIGG